MKKLILIFFLFILVSFTIDRENYNFIGNWIGTKYKFGGISKSGIDCSGFTKVLYDSVYNINLPRTASQQYKFTKRISKNKLTCGDLVFFKSPSSITGWHVGVYLSNDSFIHAANKKSGVKISCLNDLSYKKRYLGAGRVIADTNRILYKQFIEYTYSINNI